MSRVPCAIVGCGNVAKAYARHIQSYPEVELLGFADMMPERAREFAGEFGGKAYENLEAVLADEKVQLVVNLTIHHAHVEVITKCLEAGKHVHTEKPLALNSPDAHRLVKLASSKHLRFSSAPISYMGEAQQSAWELIRAGRIGTPRLVYAEVNHGRIETWHPNPEPFYEVGPLWDVGIYPLTFMTALLGPVRSVRSEARTLFPHRITQEGRAFSIKSPDCYLAVLDFAGGVTARLTANFYVAHSRQGGTLEFHGDDGSIEVGNFQDFSAAVHWTEFSSGRRHRALPVREPAHPGCEFGRGVQDLADAILNNKAHRANALHATHVIEVLEAISTSADSGQAVSVSSDFPAPWPMDWSKQPHLEPLED